MFLLLLMGLGAAGVKAQVRIGGNTAPSAAAVLDLNAGNDNVANTGTGGLVLPRVDLKTNVMQLTTGVANQTGTLVYDVTTTLGRIGVYYWNGNSWVLASLPSTTTADSGKILMNTGNGVAWIDAQQSQDTNSVVIPVAALSTYTNISFVVGGTWSFNIKPWGFVMVSAPGLKQTDFCYIRYTAGNASYILEWTDNLMYVSNLSGARVRQGTIIGCWRLS